MFQIPVERDEGVEFDLSQYQEFAIALTAPSVLLSKCHAQRTGFLAALALTHRAAVS